MFSKPSSAERILRFAAAAAALWTALVFASAWRQASTFRANMLADALAESRTAYLKDTLYRKWNAGHGGVYAPVSGHNPPNPYLSHVPERDITTDAGVELTLVNPAYMTRQVYEEAKNYDGPQGHITSLRPIRPGNAPDPWERAALLAFERGVKEVSSVEAAGGKQFMRYMRPFVTEERCLKCHGAQGYKPGDIRGGVSVSVPMAPYEEIKDRQMFDMLALHLTVWLLGVVVAGGGGRRIYKDTRALVEREEKVAKLSRVYSVLRSVNQLIVRSTDRQALFDEACRIAVKQGSFRMTWVGLADGETGTVRPVASEGCDEVYLKLIKDALTGGPEGMGPTGRAVASGAHYINNDTATNPDIAPWRDAALARGCLSSATFPLTVGEKAAGSITVYSGEAGFFDEGEVSLLDELAGDLSFALASMEQDEQRKKMEGAIKRGKEEWERTFDAITDPIMLLDTSHTITRVNKTMADKLGVTPKEAVGLTCYNAVHGLDSPHQNCPHSLLLADGQTHSAEIYEERIGGYYIVSDSPLFDADGRLCGSVHYARDITDRKRAEEAVKESEAKFRTLVDESLVGVYIIQDGRFAYVNPRFAEIFGYSMQDVSGIMPVEDLISPESRPVVLENIRRRVEGEIQSTHYQFKALGAGGREFDVEVFGSRTDYAGRPAVIGTLIDVTERNRAEAALENEVAVTGALLEAARVAGGNLDWDEVADSMAGLLLRFTGGKGVFIFTLARDGMLIPQKAAGLPEEELAPFYSLRVMAGDVGLFRQALSAKKTLRFDGDSLPMYIDAGYAGPLRLREAVVTPIPERDGVAGFILINYDSLPEDPRVAEIIEGIARQLGVAHENSRLYAETRNKGMELARSVETLKVLSEIDKKILSTLDRDEILKGAVSQIRRVAPADVAGVFLAEEEAGVLRFAYGWSLGLNVGDAVPFGQCSGYRTLKTGRTLVRRDLAEEADLSAMDGLLLDGGIKSDIFVPIVCKEKGFGLLHVGSYRVAGFSLEDVDIIENLARQMGIALENTRLISDVEDMFIGVVTAMASAIDAKSPWTKGHSERVTNYAMMTAVRMGIGQKDMDALRLGGLLHDIGKIGTYDDILDKPGKLTEEEFAMIRKHPEAGAGILGPIKQFREIIPIVRHHHERWDGKGYPAGLSGEAIPLLARILCVADSFDSMTADRPYRPSLGIEFAVEEISRCAGSQFDPEVARAFVGMLGEER